MDRLEEEELVVLENRLSALIDVGRLLVGDDLAILASALGSAEITQNREDEFVDPILKGGD